MSAVISSITSTLPDVAIYRLHWVMITGTGFSPNTAVAIYMGEEGCTRPGLFCASVKSTDASGNLNAAFQIPNFSMTGRYTVTACNAEILNDGTHRSIGQSSVFDVTIY